VQPTLPPAGFKHLPQYLGRARQQDVLGAVRRVVAEAPFYTPGMPKSGKLLSVRMTNCGSLGWVTDQTGGYRYQGRHLLTDAPWPAIPAQLLQIWEELAAYPESPEACLINHYGPASKLGSHVDADEAATEAPVLSVSLGDDAIFHVGGRKRSDAKTRMTLKSGDVVILGGAARLAYHGIDRVLPATSDLLSEGGRIVLTLRRVNRAS